MSIDTANLLAYLGLPFAPSVPGKSFLDKNNSRQQIKFHIHLPIFRLLHAIDS